MEKSPQEKMKLLSNRLNQEIALLVFVIFGVILAFAWAEAIRSLILDVLKLDEDSLKGKFAYALIVTVLIAGLIYLFVLLLKAAASAKIENS